MTRPSRPGWRHPSLPAPANGRTGLLALAVALAGLLLANMIPDGAASRHAHAQTAGSSIEYAENGTAPVGVFVAYDQDGDAIVWSLGGPDGAPVHHRRRRTGLQGAPRPRGPAVRTGGERVPGDRRGVRRHPRRGRDGHRRGRGRYGEDRQAAAPGRTAPRGQPV